MEDGESALDLEREQSVAQPHSRSIYRYVWATGTFANNATTLAKVNELVQATFSNLTTKNGNFTFSNVFQPIPRSIVSHLQRATSSKAFPDP